ncbi:hypothetical protein PHLCEN_2v1489 [Hermanssonia centrifuga]|uniref:Uncharacterized protein n=1 Tax=Hermanssonia centrifuga TaxID=98765 RepID=A0A2R6RZT8_9APHY|nr:hypothetical protein PHLCEN_2v1489 [Hermanssonia centrifuga]
MKGENELSDHLAERESALVAARKLVEEIKEELTFLKEQEAFASKLFNYRILSLGKQDDVWPAECLDYDNKESIVTNDILKEQNQDAKNELEEFKKTVGELRVAQKDASAEDKEKRKQEKMAMMMAKFDALEAQYTAKRNAHFREVHDLKQQLEIRSNEVRTLNGTIDSLKSVNEELKRAFAVTSDGIEGGKNLAESAQDLWRTRKAISVQLAEFDGVKKSLMRDLQIRFEKRFSWDEIKEQYNNVIRNSNKAQQKKTAFLERNLEQLTLVQKQLVDQNSDLKKGVGVAERRLFAQNERIQNLEALLQDADRRLAMQNQQFQAQLQQMKERLDQARGTDTNFLTIINRAHDDTFSTKSCHVFFPKLRAHREAAAGCQWWRLRHIKYYFQHEFYARVPLTPWQDCRMRKGE